jgi:tetratricopeptide (TPR) repeat protein
MSSMNPRRSNPRVWLKAKADEYLDRASDLYIFGEDNRAAVFREALAIAKRSLLLDPRNYKILVLIGDIISDIDDTRSIDQALRYYNQAIALRPECPDAYQSKAGLLMFWLNRPEEAERHARKALALSLRSGEGSEGLEFSYASLIDILVERKKFARARWYIRRALRDCPSEFMSDLVAQPLKEIESSK